VLLQAAIHLHTPETGADTTAEETDMTPTDTPAAPSSTRSSHASGRARRRTRRNSTFSRRRVRPSAARSATIASYTDCDGRAREIVTRAGCAGSVLLVDRDAATLDDRRLIAHLAADEPPENAAVTSQCYLEQARRGHCRCRRLQPEDLTAIPFADGPEAAACASQEDDPIDGLGRRYELARMHCGMSIPELRWRRQPADGEGDDRPVSVREAVACLESYEPVCSLTRRALARLDRDCAISTTALRAELSRMQQSPIVLNRALRQAVLSATERQGLSMSEIAMRCGRVKRDSAGHESGETSWLARRLGLLPEGGRATPTPWIHSDVLALIARDGLGISPREVEA
jgi:hypothetical protein